MVKTLSSKSYTSEHHLIHYGQVDSLSVNAQGPELWISVQPAAEVVDGSSSSSC